jgi:hypothetical protein
VRRRATSEATGERDGDSAVTARSDMGASVWQGKCRGSRVNPASSTIWASGARNPIGVPKVA